MFKQFLVISNLIIVCFSINPINVKYLNYNENHKFTLNDSIEYILEFTTEQRHYPARVTVSSENAQISAPLMVVARQPKQLLSWQLPLVTSNKIYRKISHTLCQDSTEVHQEMANFTNPIITVSTANKQNVTFTVLVELQLDFNLKTTDKQRQFTISPSEPKYYFYNFTTTPQNTTKPDNSNYDTVILEVTSNDNICMIVSIQNRTCPVFDMDKDITFRGFYETVNRKGGITIPKYKFPYGFYVVFVAKPDDSDCTGNTADDVINDNNRTKNLTITIKPNITYTEYYNVVVITLLSFGGFYLLFGLGFFFCSRRNYVPREMEYVSNAAVTPSSGQDQQSQQQQQQQSDDNVSLVNSEEYDTISDIDLNRYEFRLNKSVIYLNDLARKDPRIIKMKSYLYLYNVLTVAIFYGLPVVQLVIIYQNVLNETGQQDLCYYNFLCAHPFNVISDFNHVFSNIGYILLGLLFLWITYRRAITHRDLDFDRQFGIPEHYGMFYAMGVALIMEGVLSGSYHICPNKANFQFDSSFMYVMAVLSMVKLYQNRHPDINATAYATFGLLAMAIFLGLIGILEGNLLFWSCFTIIYFLICFYLTVQIYYMGCWRFNRSLLKRLYRICVCDIWINPINVLRPLYKARFCLLIVANLFNWSLAIFGVYYQQLDFAVFLLLIFMSNTLLYFIFYIIMKYIYGEYVNKLTWFFLFVAGLCAISAMYFFLHKGISWKETPARSRLFNKECRLLRFYDDHDIWHFLSAIGMFFTFMVLLTLDDDLSHKHRTQIIVF